MKKETTRFNELLARYLDNQCSRKEYEELIHLANTPGNEKLLRAFNEQDWNQKASEDSDQKAISQKRKNLNRGPRFLKIAAAIALLCTVIALLLKWDAKEDAIVYETGNGEVKEVELPDGSKATLNANSILTWIPPRSKKADRMVKLTGEAFFEVNKIPGTMSRAAYQGFQVITPKMAVHVLGTSFNVIARKQNSEIYLRDGSVKLQLPDREGGPELMKPGEKVTLDNATGQYHKTKNEEASSSASWVTGILSFVDKPMGEVLLNLSDLFGVEIICNDESLNSKKINLGVPYMDWENTKRALEMAINVEFQKGDDHYSVIQNDKK